jgi:hypothetical protein
MFGVDSNNTQPIIYSRLENPTMDDGVYEYEVFLWNDPSLKIYLNFYTVGTKDVSFKDNFQFYPNPAKDVFTIDSTLDNYNVEIYNILGKKVRLLQNASLQTKIDISDLTTGIYFVKILNNKEAFTIKLVKK